MSFRALVVGLGQIGMGYDLNHDPDQVVTTHARAFQIHPEFNLVGGVDSDSNRISLFESEYCCPGYSDLKKALKDLKPDIIVIATPTTTHLQNISIIVSESNPKAIICEKPLAYDINDATKIAESCESAGIKLFVNYMRRSDSGVIEVKRRIDNMLISQPIKGVCWYSKGLLNNGSHFLNLLQFWLGDIVNFELINKGRLWNDIDPEPDFRIIFEHGTIIFLAAYEEYYSHYAIEIMCASGRLQYSHSGSQILWQSVINDPCFEGYEILNPVFETISSDLDRIQIQVLNNLVNSLNQKESSICTARDALVTSEIIDKIGKVL